MLMLLDLVTWPSHSHLPSGRSQHRLSSELSAHSSSSQSNPPAGWLAGSLCPGHAQSHCQPSQSHMWGKYNRTITLLYHIILPSPLHSNINTALYQLPAWGWYSEKRPGAGGWLELSDWAAGAAWGTMWFYDAVIITDTVYTSHAQLSLAHS